MGSSASPLAPPPLCSLATPQILLFSTNGREAGFLSPPPLPIVISCQRFLDGRGNAQV